MKPIFDPALWGIFLRRMINTLYPVNVVLLCLLAYLAFEPLLAKLAARLSGGRLCLLRDADGNSIRAAVIDMFGKPRALPLLIFILGCDLFVRIIAFFAGVPFSHRYFYPFAFLSTLFAAVAMLALSGILHRLLTPKFPSVSRDKVLVLLLFAVVLAYSGKSLMPRFDKKWLREIPEAIRAAAPEDARPVLFTNYLDTRLAYYSGAELVQCFPKENFRMLVHAARENGNNPAWMALPPGRGSDFQRRVTELGARAFLLVRRKRGARKVAIPAFMSKVGEFADSKRKWVFTLYQGIPPEKSANGKKRPCDSQN